MDATVAIFAEEIDLHARAVRWALARNGVLTVMVPDVSGLADRFSIHADGKGLVWGSYGADTSPVNFRSAWFRRPQPPNPTHCLEEDKPFVAQQWKLFQKNVFDLGNQVLDVLWVNQPHCALRAESKLLQLHEACIVGLDFPELVVTNRTQDVAQLIKRWGRVVYKSFYPHTWQSASLGTYQSVGVVLLDEHSDLPDASIAMCPSIFQRYIDKKSDIRVTVIGDRMYAMEIVKSDGRAFLDWRSSTMDEVCVMKPFQLGHVIQQKLKALMSRLGIVFGCIDLVIDRDNNVFFLEVNQAGQFLFVEDKDGSLPMLQSVTALLMEGRCDYSLEAGKKVSLADYFASDEYQEALKSNDRPHAISALTMER